MDLTKTLQKFEKFIMKKQNNHKAAVPKYTCFQLSEHAMKSRKWKEKGIHSRKESVKEELVQNRDLYPGM